MTIPIADVFGITENHYMCVDVDLHKLEVWIEQHRDDIQQAVHMRCGEHHYAFSERGLKAIVCADGERLASMFVNALQEEYSNPTER